MYNIKKETETENETQSEKLSRSSQRRRGKLVLWKLRGMVLPREKHGQPKEKVGHRWMVTCMNE